MASILVNTRTLCGVTVQMVGIRQFGTNWCTVDALTACCDAAQTGATSGIICKGCKQPTEHTERLSFYDLARVLGERGCPSPCDCAEYTLSVLDREFSAAA